MLRKELAAIKKNLCKISFISHLPSRSGTDNNSLTQDTLLALQENSKGSQGGAQPRTRKKGQLVEIPELDAGFF
jgi:hypothetical protein